MTADPKRPLRVIQWSTGNAGSKALAGIVRHADPELAGVYAFSEEKVGLDASELCDLDQATGGRAPSDLDALLTLDVDCGCYAARGERRIRERR